MTPLSFLSTVCVLFDIFFRSWSVTVLWFCLVTFRWRCLTRTRMGVWIWMIWRGDDDLMWSSDCDWSIGCVCVLSQSGLVHVSFCVLLIIWWWSKVFLLTGSWRWRRTSCWSLRWRRVRYKLDWAVAGNCGWCDSIMLGLCGASPSDQWEDEMIYQMSPKISCNQAL